MIHLLFALLCAPSFAFTVLDLNVFDQQQGKWQPGFRSSRLHALTTFIKQKKPDLVVFQEAQPSDDGELTRNYPFRHYISEMQGKEGESYGYWMGSKVKPEQWIEEGFFFPGGVNRKVQGALFQLDSGCLGVLSLHLSYQNSNVRTQEAHWLLDWIEKNKSCDRWLVLGDFNADESSPEMKLLFSRLPHLYAELRPTVGAFNPIRRIYGEHIPSQTIDWALGTNGLAAEASVILDSPWQGTWISDHAGIWISVNENNKGEKK